MTTNKSHRDATISTNKRILKGIHMSTFHKIFKINHLYIWYEDI